MKRHALIAALLFCAAAAQAQDPAASDCGASPSADVCAAKPKTTDIFGLPLPSIGAAKAEKKAAKKESLPAGGSSGQIRPLQPAALPPQAPDETAKAAPDQPQPGPDFSSLERASTSLHFWLGLALAFLAASEAFAADNPGRRTVALAGFALSAALSLAAIAAAALELGPESRNLLSFRPGFLLYYGAGLLAASAALSQLLSRHSGNGGGFWGAASGFFLAAAGVLLLMMPARVNPEAASFVMAGHVPVAAALLAAGAARAFLLFYSSAPARAALAVFLFIAAAMSGLYKESPDAFSLHFSTVTDAGTPADGAEKAATGRINEEAADKKGPRG